MRKSIVSNFLATLGSSIFSFSLGLMLMNQTGLSVSFALSVMVSTVVNIPSIQKNQGYRHIFSE